MTGEQSALSAPRSTYMINWLSVERLLYGTAVVIGVWLRFWTLDAQPLSPWEASNSWPAWLAANGLVVQDAPSPISALYYGLQWLTFWIGVNNDAGARFVSAVAGSVLVLLPWWWRELLGRRVALIAAFLIAFDSWLLAFSRFADGASVALTIALLTLIATTRVAQQPEATGWKRIASASVGLLLISGPMGWNFVPVVLWWGWLLREQLRAAGLFQREWLVWVGVTVVVAGTMLFARMDALAWLASGMSIWLAQLDGRNAAALLPKISGGYGLAWPWIRLWTDAALLLPLGLGGFVVIAVRAGRSEKQSRAEQLLYLFGGWLVWGALLWLLPGRSPLALPVLGLPLLFLSAFALDTLLSNIPQNMDWREAGAVILTLSILYVSGALWLAALLANRNYDPVLAQATLVIFGLAVAILVAFGVWANRRDAAWVAASLLATLLLVFYVRSSWKLSFANVLAEPAGWQATIAHPEVRLLAGDMETLSSHRTGDPYQLPVQVQVAPYATQDDQIIPARPDPVLGWELRNMRNLTWVTSPQVSEEDVPLPLVVTPVSGSEEVAQLDLPDSYVGSTYHVDSWWLPQTLVDEAVAAPADEESVARLWARALQPWWRWFVYREASVPPQPRDVVLWASLESTAE